MKRTLYIILVCLFFPAISSAGQNEISITIGSYHTDRKTDWNEKNLGFYFARYSEKKYLKARPFAFGGVFDNSEYHTSVIAGTGLLWEKGIFGISPILGAVTGYEKNNVSIAAALQLHVSVINIIVIPDIPNDQLVFGLGLNVTKIFKRGKSWLKPIK